jgi:MFS family permease
VFSHITKDFLGNKQSIAIGWVFLSLGLLFGSWATFIPSVKHNFDLDDAELGILLLSLPFGALVMNPIAAMCIRKIGMRKTTIWGWCLLLLAYSFILNTQNLYLLSFFLFLTGSAVAVTNVGMNTCVGSIETHQQIKIMSTCHGIFSLGLMIGSLVSSFFNGLHADPGYYMIAICFLLSLTILYSRPIILSLFDEHGEQKLEKAKFQFPNGNFLWMIIISLCINITEGSMADWTAVYMREIVQTNPYFEGWGFAGYSFLMASGRLLGDKIIPKYGANKILIYGGILSVIGILVALVLPFTFSAILGFALVGAGVSCGAPILYASSSRVPNMPKGSGLALMNTFAMGGFLFGPVIIGFISKGTSLSMAFTLIATLGLVWIFYSKRVKLF